MVSTPLVVEGAIGRSCQVVAQPLLIPGTLMLTLIVIAIPLFVWHPLFLYGVLDLSPFESLALRSSPLLIHVLHG